MICTQCREPFLNINAFDNHLNGTPSRRKPCRNPSTIGMVKIRDQWATKTPAKETTQ